MILWQIALPATAAAATGLAAWGAFHPSSQLFGRTIRHTGHGSACALTFDDGPNPAATPQLLDLLDRYQVRATFFLLGKYIRACPGLATEISARGHTIGNHTDTHPNLLWLSPRRIASEFRRCQEAIQNATGKHTVWVRPPYGFRGPQLNRTVRQAGLAGVVMWSLTGKDWTSQPPSRVATRLRKVRGGDIILLHDGDHRSLGADLSHTLRALEFWFPQWKDAGLEFVTLDAVAHHVNG